MADSLPPVAIRVARPFANEDDLLENELETFTRTSITLLGAQPRPPGLVLRFELVLATGAVLVRGEGRVVGYKPDAHFGTGGLTLRFTRLDTRSKALVDRAAAMRERRRPSAVPATVLDALTPSQSSLDDERPQAGPRSFDASEPSAPELPTLANTDGARTLPRDREALLERLRARSKATGAKQRL